MSSDFLSVTLDGRQLGVPALRVREVVRLSAITRVPRAPAMVAGVMNLRGQLVTAIDLRARLGLAPRVAGAAGMAVLVEHQEHVYAFIVDSVGDVVPSRPERQEAPPQTLAPMWRAVALTVQRDEVLTLVLDVDAVLDLPQVQVAA